MVKLNAEMKETFGKIKLFPVATALKSGVPNVVPIAFVSLVSDDTIWIAHNYMHKTLANVKENPALAVYTYAPESKKCFQINGSVPYFKGPSVPQGLTEEACSNVNIVTSVTPDQVRNRRD